MIDIKSLVPVVCQKVEKLGAGGVIELKTYKRDRGVDIIKISDETLRIIESGFEKRQFSIPVSRLKKTLKSIVKREFPRSNKVRIAVKNG
jgi:hypothetical protein